MRSFPQLIILSMLALAPVPAVAAARAVAPAPQTQPVKIDYRERYSVLTDRNMFLRDRRRAGFTREPTSRPVYVARPVDETLILTGIVLEEGEYRAYFEDTQASSVLRLRVGESVGRGVISQIQMDAIEYLNGEQHIWIDIGHTLTGATPPPSTPSWRADAGPGPGPVASGSTTQPATSTTPLINPNDPNLTLEEKMKLRRQQELNR